MNFNLKRTLTKVIRLILVIIYFLKERNRQHYNLESRRRYAISIHKVEKLLFTYVVSLFPSSIVRVYLKILLAVKKKKKKDIEVSLLQLFLSILI